MLAVLAACLGTACGAGSVRSESPCDAEVATPAGGAAPVASKAPDAGEGVGPAAAPAGRADDAGHRDDAGHPDDAGAPFDGGGVGDAGAADAASGDAGSGCPDPTFTSLYGIVFGASCAVSRCHLLSNAPSAYFNMGPTQATAYPAMVNAVSWESGLSRVRPGDPSRSYLYLKIAQPMPLHGARMPLDQPALPDCSISAVALWIQNGAPNN